MNFVLTEHIRKMPKIDLHCHLDGSLPVETVRHLTGKQDLKMAELQADHDCDSLKTYLEKFDLPLAGMQTEEGLRTAARDFLRSLAKEKMAYVEVRFAPMLSVHQGLSCPRVLEAVLEGMKDGEKETGIRWQVISCAMRHHTLEQNQIMLRAAREYLHEGVCAVDLAGDEASYPAKEFRPLFAEARKLEVPFTIHAGECGSAENIRESIAMGAGRIGHGIAMRGQEELMLEAAQKRIGIELCPTSNFQTKAVKPGEEYPLSAFWNKGILVTVNTDNRTVSQTTMTRELAFAGKMMEESKMTADAAADKLMKNAVEASFLSEEGKAELFAILAEKESS